MKIVFTDSNVVTVYANRFMACVSTPDMAITFGEQQMIDGGRTEGEEVIVVDEKVRITLSWESLPTLINLLQQAHDAHFLKGVGAT